jgi:hypothetical protein
LNDNQARGYIELEKLASSDILIATLRIDIRLSGSTRKNKRRIRYGSLAAEDRITLSGY